MIINRLSIHASFNFCSSSVGSSALWHILVDDGKKCSMCVPNMCNTRTAEAGKTRVHNEYLHGQTWAEPCKPQFTSRTLQAACMNTLPRCKCMWLSILSRHCLPPSTSALWDLAGSPCCSMSHCTPVWHLRRSAWPRHIFSHTSLHSGCLRGSGSHTYTHTLSGVCSAFDLAFIAISMFIFTKHICSAEVGGPVSQRADVPSVISLDRSAAGDEIHYSATSVDK